MNRMNRRLALATALIGLSPITAIAHPGHQVMDRGPLHVVSEHGAIGLVLIPLVMVAIWMASRAMLRTKNS